MINKRKQLLSLLRRTKKGVIKIVIDALCWVYSIIIEGLSYLSVKRLFTHNEIEIPTKKEFYQQQKIVSKAIHELAVAKCELAKAQLAENSFVSIDGSWDHPRNGSLCVVSMMDTQSKKFVDYEVVEKLHRNLRL
jgi:hypothetical protein